MLCLYSILSKGFSVCSEENSSLYRCLNDHVWSHCPATWTLSIPSPAILHLVFHCFTLNSTLCPQHYSPFFHCFTALFPHQVYWSLSDILCILYLFLFILLIIYLPTLDSMKRAVYFFFWSPTSRAVSSKTGAQALFFGLNELIHGHFLAPCCFVAWSHVVSPKGDKEALWCKYLHLIINMSTAAATAAKSLQLCQTLCDPRDGSSPGSPIPGILQARTLEWVAISFSNAWKWKVKVKSLSCVQLPATPWTAAYQAPPYEYRRCQISQSVSF